ncbi:hypothetical protein L1987_21184 [Smallanthus sonchifolius]|uniref:Uncharacterized protein n=1 Tax=Smallanthus sonchifolius TaxID=185202 RepID=A0ACB9IVT4_9ASTR|nr:hypothetical protein L1987_21184 [Smallanthus sonchifolius]
MAVKEFKKFFKRRGKFLRQPCDDRKSPKNTERSSQDEKKDKPKRDRKCYRYGDPNHFIGDCSKLPRKDNKNESFLDGARSDNSDENEEAKEETYPIALEINEETSFSNDILTI